MKRFLGWWRAVSGRAANVLNASGGRVPPLLLWLMFGSALHAAPAPDVTVAADGSGKYASLQEAISAAPMRTGLGDPRWVIYVKAGTYKERIYVQRERGNIAVIGEDAATTVITYDLNANLPGPDGKSIGTFRTPTLQIDGDGMVWENITIANGAGPVGQALALRVDADRVVFRNCRFLGWQDTILLNRGRQYFADCYVEGHVDFIFGGATAYFDRCHIHCLKDGYLTAASTPEGQPYGFVFADGRITGAEGVKSFLGRPWRNYARTIFLRTEMSAAVRPEGWNNWNKPEAEKNTCYAEFGSTGPGANDAARVKWAKPLTAAEAATLTPAKVLAGTDGWNPAATEQAKLNLVLVGDSTVTDHAGWGLGFKEFLTDAVVCTNTAQGGRSSKSFIDEGRWTQALALKGDYYLIQFGHNDEPGKGPARETDPATTFTRNMARYVDEARAIGAQPVLVTSLTRRNFDPAHPDRIKSSLVPYVEAVKKLAAEKGVPLIDLHARSIELCEKLGPAGVKQFNVIKDGKADTTHLDPAGSVVFARLVVEELRRAVPKLAPVLRTEPRQAVPVAAATPPDAIVSADGSGTHTTVQAAVAAAPAGRSGPFVILIKPGTYKEHVVVPADKPFITFRGEDAAATILTQNTNLGTVDTTGRKLTALESATVLVEANNFTAEKITFENTTPLAQHVQALAMYVTGDRAVFRGCRFLGWQDTLRADSPKPAGAEPDVARPNGNARQYFAECYVEGHVDFIYGAGTAVFDRCHVHGKADGYLTAASTPRDVAHGYVFLDCRITVAAEAINGVYLGRPWRSFAAVAFLRTEMPLGVRPEGWENWKKPENEKAARYVEYRNTGPGARPEARVPWSRQLTDEEAKAYTVENILRGADGWNPAKK